jgi:hypothetical protein
VREKPPILRSSTDGSGCKAIDDSEQPIIYTPSSSARSPGRRKRLYIKTQKEDVPGDMKAIGRWREYTRDGDEES